MLNMLPQYEPRSNGASCRDDWAKQPRGGFGPIPVVDPRAVSLPDGLEEMPPGPELGVLLASVDRTRLTGHDLVVLLAARARQVSFDQAELYADIAEVAHATEPDTVDRSEVVVEYSSDEIRAALSLTRRAADSALDLASGLERLPRVWEALSHGSIDLPRARVLCEGTSHLEESTAREAVDAVLGGRIPLHHRPVGRPAPPGHPGTGPR